MLKLTLSRPKKRALVSALRQTSASSSFPTYISTYPSRTHKIFLRDTFIYEYVGEVVNSPSFKKRMRDYASEGICHFYFMMLQKDEVCSLLYPLVYSDNL
jgi:hypothetical protein